MLIKVKASEGLNVRNPESGAIISGEIYIERSPAIVRMLKDGDLIEVSEQAKPEPKVKAQKATEKGAEQ